jgi:hypothetical protein
LETGKRRKVLSVLRKYMYLGRNMTFLLREPWRLIRVLIIKAMKMIIFYICFNNTGGFDR